MDDWITGIRTDIEASVFDEARCASMRRLEWLVSRRENKVYYAEEIQRRRSMRDLKRDRPAETALRLSGPRTTGKIKGASGGGGRGVREEVPRNINVEIAAR